MRTSLAAIRAALAVAAVGATLAVAAPAQAATHALSCESGYSTIVCDVNGPADSVRWTLNGTYIPSWDNKFYISTACSSGRYTFTATVTSGGVTETPTYSILCWKGPWR